MMIGTDWIWLTGVVIFPALLTVWNIKNHRKGSMFFLAILFLAESNLAKLMVVLLYLIWSIGAHLRYKNIRTGKQPPRFKKHPVRESKSMPKCPSAPKSP